MQTKRSHLTVCNTSIWWCENSPTATSPEQNNKREETSVRQSWFYIQWAGWAMKMMDNPSLSLSDDNNTLKSFMSASPMAHVETFSTWTIVPFLFPLTRSVSLLWYLGVVLKKASTKMKYQLFGGEIIYVLKLQCGTSVGLFSHLVLLLRCVSSRDPFIWFPPGLWYSRSRLIYCRTKQTQERAVSHWRSVKQHNRNGFKKGNLCPTSSDGKINESV